MSNTSSCTEPTQRDLLEIVKLKEKTVCMKDNEQKSSIEIKFHNLGVILHILLWNPSRLNLLGL